MSPRNGVLCDIELLRDVAESMWHTIPLDR